MSAFSVFLRVVIVHVVVVSVRGAPFSNLGFDEVDAYSVSDTQVGGLRLSWSGLLLPGWRLDPGGEHVRMSVDEKVLGPTIYTTNVQQLPFSFLRPQGQPLK